MLSPRQLEAVLSEAEGFEQLVLSEPIRGKAWSRLGWAWFDSAEHCDAAARLLDGREVAVK